MTDEIDNNIYFLKSNLHVPDKSLLKILTVKIPVHQKKTISGVW